MRGQRPRAATRGALDQAFLRQLAQGTAHRDAGHAKLGHQRHLAGQAALELPFAQLLAQHQVDLVVFGQGHVGSHGGQ